MPRRGTKLYAHVNVHPLPIRPVSHYLRHQNDVQRGKRTTSLQNHLSCSWSFGELGSHTQNITKGSHSNSLIHLLAVHTRIIGIITDSTKLANIAIKVEMSLYFMNVSFCAILHLLNNVHTRNIIFAINMVLWV